MNLTYFAHNGVEHATATEATSHDDASNLPIILAVTVVAVLAILAVTKFLSAGNKPSTKKEDK